MIVLNKEVISIFSILVSCINVLHCFFFLVKNMFSIPMMVKIVKTTVKSMVLSEFVVKICFVIVDWFIDLTEFVVVDLILVPLLILSLLKTLIYLK